jgi:hypothetical protein
MQQRRTLQNWVDIIGKALKAPIENFPNPAVNKSEPYNREAWIMNWLCMTCEYNPRDVINQLNDPPQWLIEWCDKYYPTDK